MPDIADSLQPLDDVIHCTFLVSLLGFSPPNDTTHDLFVYLLIEGAEDFMFRYTLLLLTSQGLHHVALVQSSH